MNPVPMQCPLCAGMIQIDPAYAGQQVGCPLCQGVMLLPPPEFFGLSPAVYSAEQPPNYPPPYPPQDFSQPAPPPQEAPPTLPQLGCPVCGGAFQVSPEMAGHQVACPHCQNAVSIPDLFGGAYSAGPGFAPPPPPPPNFPTQGPAYFEMPPQPMQFISPPIGPMEVQEIPTGYAVQSMPPPDFAPPEPEMIPGVPVGLAIAPPPHDDRFPPSRTREQTAPTPTSVERRGDVNLYPPGKTPKDAPAKKDRERAEQPERLRDDRFPPGMGRSESQERKTAENKPAEARTDDVPPSQVDDLLPPAAAPLLPPATAPQSTVDALLPPGAAAGLVASEAEETISRHAVVDTLLPPGAAADPSAMPTEQVALPDAPPPAPKPMPAAAPGRLIVPTPDGDYVTVEKKEGVKTISDRGEEIEIRKLSPEEKLRRRRVKNAVMFVLAILVLGAVIYIMTRK